MFLTIFSIVLCLIIIGISIIYRKLTFWSRQGIPNDLSSRSQQPFHLSDSESHRKYGKIVGFYEGLKPCLSVTNPQLIKRILVTEFHKFADHRNPTGPTEPIHTALFFLPYPQWKRIRTILSPSFSTAKLKALKPLICKSMNALIRKLESNAKKSEIIDLREYYDSFTFDVISKCAFGLNLDIIEDNKNAIFESAKMFFQSNIGFKKLFLFAFPKLNKYLDLYFFDEECQRTIAQNIKEVIAQRIDNNIQSIDLLQHLIDASLVSNKTSNQTKNSFQKLTEDEVIAQCLNFMGAGYETTSTQLCFISHFLALNPEYQNKLFDEINSTFDDISNIDFEILMKMQYLDAFVKEIMRVNCSVNRIDRMAVSDCVIHNIFIPKDTPIVIPIWALHMDPDIYEEPNAFKPQRFMQNQSQDRNDCTYLPFATGPRNCIGMRFALMEIKYFLVNIITKFQFEACHQTNNLEFHKLNQVANMKSMMVRINERNSTKTASL